jgi:outer membrane protein
MESYSKYFLLTRFFILALALTVSHGSAVNAADILEVYRDAASTNPQLYGAAADRRAIQEIKPQARALLLPSLSGSGVYSRSEGVRQDSNQLGRSNRSSSDNRSFDVTLSQPLYNRESRYRIRQANVVVDQADADFVTIQQNLILTVVERYFDVLAAIDNLTFRTADKGAIGRQLEQARRRFEVGLVTITDVLEAQARFDLAVADEIDARNQVASSREALREITGEYYDLFQRLDDNAPIEPVDPTDPDAWVAIALENNPEVVSSRLNVASAQENIEIQKSGHYPTVDLQGRYFDSNTGSIDSDGSEILLQLNVPFYQGGAVNSRTREAAFQFESAKELLEEVQRDTILQTRDAYRGLETARSRIQALGQARVSNESSLEATQAGFDVGTRTIVDVLNAERNLLEAIRDLSISRYDYIVNRLRLLRAAGKISSQDIRAINAWLRPPRS